MCNNDHNSMIVELKAVRNTSGEKKPSEDDSPSDI